VFLAERSAGCLRAALAALEPSTHRESCVRVCALLGAAAARRATGDPLRNARAAARYYRRALAAAARGGREMLRRRGELSVLLATCRVNLACALLQRRLLEQQRGLPRAPRALQGDLGRNEWEMYADPKLLDGTPVLRAPEAPGEAAEDRARALLGAALRVFSRDTHPIEHDTVQRYLERLEVATPSPPSAPRSFPPSCDALYKVHCFASQITPTVPPVSHPAVASAPCVARLHLPHLPPRPPPLPPQHRVSEGRWMMSAGLSRAARRCRCRT